VPAANGSWADAQEHEVLLYSWASFSHAVKHQTRFHFQRLEGDPHDREVQVSDMLDVVERSFAPLVRIVEEGTRIFRARHLSQEDRGRAQAHMFGAPPKEKAAAGRMNPAGIPYFYSALDAATAVAEIGTPMAGRAPVAAEFMINRSLRVVDFTQLPNEPSIFALERKQEREQVLFLSGFVGSISQPVIKDGREHIDYVPSQVVCEYLAQVAFQDAAQPLDGVIFPSSVQDGGTNLVIFPSGQWFQSDRFPGVEFVGLA
jgi:RES domain-containing protein